MRASVPGFSFTAPKTPANVTLLGRGVGTRFSVRRFCEFFCRRTEYHLNQDIYACISGIYASPGSRVARQQRFITLPRTRLGSQLRICACASCKRYTDIQMPMKSRPRRKSRCIVPSRPQRQHRVSHRQSPIPLFTPAPSPKSSPGTCHRSHRVMPATIGPP